MKAHLFVLFLFFGATVLSQNTTNKELGEILHRFSDRVEGQEGSWQFEIEERPFICLTDQTNNRMRIITPVVEVQNISQEQLKHALVANFHTALDVKYAISDDILWSVFIHPLKELTENQIIDAISQVFYAAETFGTIYSSSNLTFPGNSDDNMPAEEQEEKPTKELKLQKG